MKSLITYFSASGITKSLAEKIAQVVKGDIFEIKPLQPYTKEDLDWQNEQSRSSIEMKDYSSRPAILEMLPTMHEYDVIYVGFPIWWYIAPTIINTFLESYDFKGKIIVPFATSGGSGIGKTDQYLLASCSKSTTYKPATRLAHNSDAKAINRWITSLGLE